MKNLTQLAGVLQNRRAKTRMFRRFMVRSSVATILREHKGELQVLLIKRAHKEGDPWSGDIAFPGGREEAQDQSIRDTAVRETFEEIGLSLSEGAYVGRMSDVMTLAHGARRPMVVSPYVFRVDGNPKFDPNHEVDQVIWLPLAFLAENENRQKMNWKKKGLSMTLPCYFYNQHRIWGLTLKMLDELVFELWL
jgi:8-oxo-dGTP pyrophosphatase MutT (NUDIX family)